MKEKTAWFLGMTALLAFSLPAWSSQPNIVPGLWETTSTTSFEGPMEIPDETDSEQECITEEDLEDAESFLLEEDEDCTYSDQEVTSDRMTGTMQCQYDEETSATLEIDMNFRGETADGSLTGALDTPMGEIRIETEMEGERLEDC